MLAVPARTEIRLEKGVRRQRAGRGLLLKIAKMAEVAFVGVLCVRIIQPGKRFAVVAVDGPVDARVRKPAEDAGAREDLDRIIKVPKRSRRGGECPVRYRLSRRRREPVVANRK